MTAVIEWCTKDETGKGGASKSSKTKEIPIK